jgi:hypothetical protein
MIQVIAEAVYLIAEIAVLVAFLVTVFSEVWKAIKEALGWK